ncbi:MAG: hypothetical protein Ta2G_08350 [Termitinemataceae bacterium]|nr:MAG: hypothetical protein Ta2G_08350 [Termitinemataceae bacterium]
MDKKADKKSYYYLIAQLPWLQYGEPAPYTPDEFLEQCEGILSKNDYEILQYCTMDVSILDAAPHTNCHLLNTWVARERTLRYNLAQLRSVKLKRGRQDEHTEAPHDSPRAEAVANAAFAMNNPLKAELMMDKGRWETVDALQSGGIFSIDAIFAHMLKLRLMQRRAYFEEEEGQAEFDALYTSISQEADKLLQYK